MAPAENSEALRGHLTASEGVARPLAPLVLGDPEQPALTFTDDRLRGHVVVTSANPTVFVGPLGIAAIRHWAECFAAKPSGSELELWTAAGITQETQTPARTVRVWIKRPDFPAPFARPVGGGAVWEADRIRAWIATSRPKIGRPRATA